VRDSILDNRVSIVKASKYLTDAQKKYWVNFSAIMKKPIEFSLEHSNLDYNLKKANGLWYSGGVESVIGDKILYNHDKLSLVLGTDYWYLGTLEGTLAIIGAYLGYANTIIGIEESSSLIGSSVNRLWGGYEPTGDFLGSNYEQTDSWLHDWGKYASPCTIQSVVSCWHKDELLKKVIDLGKLGDVRSCENTLPENEWCGRCWKCFVIKVLLDYLGEPCKFKLEPGTVEKFNREYQVYRETGIDPLVRYGILDRIGYNF
jgi:hypothetical protein